MIKSILLTVALLASANASASWSAWETTTFNSQDGSINAGAILDTEAGIEWMKTYATKGMSYNQVSGMLDTTLKGWRPPTNSEVENFFTTYLVRAGITGSSTRYSYNDVAY